MPKQWYDDTDYRIGRTSSDLVRLRDIDIAPPDQAVFQPAQEYYARGDLSRVGDGYATVTWVWDNISLHRLAGLLEFLDGADYANVYIFTDRRDGRSFLPSEAFNMYSAIMWWPLLFGPEGTPLARSSYVLQTVRIQFKNVIFWASYPL